MSTSYDILKSMVKDFEEQLEETSKRCVGEVSQAFKYGYLLSLMKTMVISSDYQSPASYLREHIEHMKKQNS